MSDYATSLAALTSVLPFSGLGYIDAGDAHSIGPIEPPDNCIGVLAGVDVWLAGPMASIGQIILIDQLTTFAFWAGAFPMNEFEPGCGCYRSYRGGFIIPQGGQVNIQYLELAGSATSCNYAYWGYYIPDGWSPVGLPPQQ